MRLLVLLMVLAGISGCMDPPAVAPSAEPLQEPIPTSEDVEPEGRQAEPTGTAPPESRTAFQGHEEVNTESLDHAIRVLHGDAQPERGVEDTAYERTHLREQTYLQ